jgi:hypothetical protein
VGGGSGRFGLAIEKAIGIPANSDKQADFMGIELKTKKDNTLQTLFSRIPSRYLGCKDKLDLVKKFGYIDNKRKRRALYTSFSRRTDTLGFKLKAGVDSIQVVRNKLVLLEYDADRLEAALLSKHSQTAYISLSVRKKKNRSECRIESVLYCKWPSIIKFMRLVRKGHVFLDFTLSVANGKVKDHGFLWRVRPSEIRDLYLHAEELDLENA